MGGLGPLSAFRPRARGTAWMMMPMRSWLKLVMMLRKPLFSLPSRFSTGTLVSSKVMYVVPLLHTPWQSMRRVLTPPCERSISSSETPSMPGPPLRTAVVK